MGLRDKILLARHWHPVLTSNVMGLCIKWAQRKLLCPDPGVCGHGRRGLSSGLTHDLELACDGEEGLIGSRVGCQEGFEVTGLQVQRPRGKRDLGEFKGESSRIWLEQDGIQGLCGDAMSLDAAGQGLGLSCEPAGDLEPRKSLPCRMTWSNMIFREATLTIVVILGTYWSEINVICH